MRLYRTAVVAAVAAIACAFAGTASAETLTYTIQGVPSSSLAGIPNYFSGSATNASESGSFLTQVYATFATTPTPVAPGGYFNLTIKNGKKVTRSLRATYTSGTLTPPDPFCGGRKKYALEGQLAVESGGVGQLDTLVDTYQSLWPWGGCMVTLLSISGSVTFAG